MKFSAPLLAVVLLLVGIATGMIIERFTTPETPALTDRQETAVEHALKHLEPTYVCPMHAEIVGAEPGTCPICGMDLVAVKAPIAEAVDSNNPHPVIEVAGQIQNSLGVKIEPVTRRTLVRKFRAPGFIRSIKPRNRLSIKAPVAGTVQDLTITRLPHDVSRGDLLFRISSPALAEAQQAHVRLLQANDSEGLALCRQQLRYLGLDDQQIANIEESKDTTGIIDIRAPKAGTVEEIKIRNDALLAAEDVAMVLRPMARVTVVADAVQRDAAWVRTGYRAELILPHVSGQHWPGRVANNVLQSSASARTIGMALNFAIPEHLIQKNMYVKVTIFGSRHKDVLTIPREAIIRTEKDVRVVRALPNGRFQPVSIKTGIEHDGFTEVLDGLQQGDRIVTSAQFLFDSESNLQASFRRLSAE